MITTFITVVVSDFQSCKSLYIYIFIFDYYLTNNLILYLIIFFVSFKEIDDYIAKARDQGYNTVLQLGTKGLSYATAVVMQTALKVC